MGKRPKKHIVLFLVEGKSDREALSIAISSLYEKIDENISVYFPIMREECNEVGGDITSDFSTYPNNIENRIYDRFLKDFFDQRKIFPKDITEIVQIVDMDGAYIEDDLICNGEIPNGEKIYYKDDSIVVNNPIRIVKRNEKKRENINYLSSLDFIKVRQKKVKYSIYYFSSNLDHFLHNNANLDYRAKVSKADEFANAYIENSEKFVDFFANHPASVKNMTYEESWNYIKTRGLNSLQRHTNINILLNFLLEKSKEKE